MSGQFKVKTYIVMERLNVPTANGDNVKAVGAYLTRERAESHVDRVPGTFIEKLTASK